MTGRRSATAAAGTRRRGLALSRRCWWDAASTPHVTLSSAWASCRSGPVTCPSCRVRLLTTVCVNAVFGGHTAKQHTGGRGGAASRPQRTEVLPLPERQLRRDGCVRQQRLPHRVVPFCVRRPDRHGTFTCVWGMERRCFAPLACAVSVAIHQRKRHMSPLYPACDGIALPCRFVSPRASGTAATSAAQRQKAARRRGRRPRASLVMCPSILMCETRLQCIVFRAPPT